MTSASVMVCGQFWRFRRRQCRTAVAPHNLASILDSQEPTRAGNPPLAAICRGRGTGNNATDNDGHGTTVFQPLQWSGARGTSASERRVRARTAAAAETQFGSCSGSGKPRDRRCGQQWAWPGVAARKGHPMAMRTTCIRGQGPPLRPRRRCSAARLQPHPTFTSAATGSTSGSRGGRTAPAPVAVVLRACPGPGMRGGSRIDRTVMAAMQVEIKFLRLFQEVAIADHIDGWRVCWIGRALMSSIPIELAED